MVLASQMKMVLQGRQNAEVLSPKLSFPVFTYVCHHMVQCLDVHEGNEITCQSIMYTCMYNMITDCRDTDYMHIGAMVLCYLGPLIYMW